MFQSSMAVKNEEQVKPERSAVEAGKGVSIRILLSVWSLLSLMLLFPHRLTVTSLRARTHTHQSSALTYHCTHSGGGEGEREGRRANLLFLNLCLPLTGRMCSVVGSGETD